MFHRTRHLFIHQQTVHLCRVIGIVAPVGRNGVEELLGVFADLSDKRVPRLRTRVSPRSTLSRGCSHSSSGADPA
jgi:transposase